MKYFNICQVCFLVTYFHFQKLIKKLKKKGAKMASYTDLFKDEGFSEIEMNENNNNIEKLPIELFQEIEVELLDSLVNTDSDDETDGPINFIKQVVESVGEEFDSVVEEEDKKTFIHLLTRF